MFGLYDKKRAYKGNRLLVKYGTLFSGGCLPLGLLKVFFQKYHNLGVSIDKYALVLRKLENDDLKSITESEHKTLNFYFSILLYCLAYDSVRLADQDKEGKVLEIFIMVKSIISENYSLNWLNKKYPNNSSAPDLYYIKYLPLINLNISPAVYASKSGEELMQMLGTE